uniref:Uncharacterized protein n=1 Tax=Eutreptiella gymnastica TaxID=73025 RepID=A0A7S1IPX2_9EUGL|mmetsp:Transcript_33867/g.60756  ORF Transcript_33867/g.60756 Transcript_33867/m.60756 type:complete len:156 (+) Transcript_33867:457-924(+)
MQTARLAKENRQLEHELAVARCKIQKMNIQQERQLEHLRSMYQQRIDKIFKSRGMDSKMLGKDKRRAIRQDAIIRVDSMQSMPSVETPEVQKAPFDCPPSGSPRAESWKVISPIDGTNDQWANLRSYILTNVCNMTQSTKDLQDAVFPDLPSMTR